MLHGLRWFQFNLVTAMATMLAASGVVFLNTQVRHEQIRHSMQPGTSVSISEAMQINASLHRQHWGDHAELLHIRQYGWPFLFWDRWNAVYANDGKWVDIDDHNPFVSTLLNDGAMHLFWNGLTGLGTVVFAGVAVQVLIRKRS